MHCAGVHTLAPSLPPLHSFFLFRRLTPVSPSLLDSLQREPPSLSKCHSPWCLWLIGCGLIPTLLQPVPIVSHSQRAACGWRTDWLSEQTPDMDIWAWRGCILSPGETIIHLQPSAAICILLGERNRARERESERAGLRVLVALGCLFNS